ncbi:MAG: pyruvate dehydrogenase complex dihydrolipoamide acetyltransferase [Bacteroidota bacterium]
MAEVIRMPRLSDTMTDGKIVVWYKKVGDKIKQGDTLADVETDKATMELESYWSGTLLYIGVEAGNAVKVDGILAVVGKEGEDFKSLIIETPKVDASATKQGTANSTAPAATAAPEEKMAAPVVVSDERIKASPLAKKVAAEKGIDISMLSGSGDGGRVIKKDVDQYTPSAAKKDAAPMVSFVASTTESYTDIELTQMRKTIARRLSESMFGAPHFYLTMEINMDNAITARNAINEVSPVKVSFNDMIIKACAAALRQHPDVNSSWMNDFIRRNHHIHIGSAVAMPEGLIVPVVKFADQKSLSQIAAETKSLYSKAKDKKLQPAEFSGNTFTISNLGMMDIEEFTAIINPPDSCILAVGRIKEVVIKKGDSFGVTNIMKLTLSCDHRSVDGAVGASFLQTLKRYIENPVTMLV